VNDDGKTVVMTTHFMDEAEESDEVAIIKGGRFGNIPARQYASK